MKSKDFLNEAKIAKGAGVGDVVKIGVPGHRGAGYLTKIKSVTDTTATTNDGKTFDRRTGLLKGHDKKPLLGKTPVMHLATEKDIEENYKNQLAKIVSNFNHAKLSTEQLEKLVKALGDITNTNYSIYHFSRGHVNSGKDM